MNRYFTTPIYYVNSKPHLGHAFTMISTDYLARFYRLIGDDVYFLTGTDEHGKKIKESADKKGVMPKEFVDIIVKEFKENWNKLNLSFDSFIRTTDKKHEKFVQEIFQKLYDNGDLYKGVYKGKYCISCEAYYGDDELLEGNLCPIHKKPIIDMEEETYFFKLSKYEKDVKAFINNENIFPSRYRNELLGRLKNGLKDISVSRKTLDWGITLPFDKEHVIYVWFDALLNYLSALEINKKQDFWPATHIIGKDILWFHAVYWPALVKAIDKDMPKLFVHGWWTVNGEKMSKTIGNIITIDKIIKYGLDVGRFFLLRQMPYGEDSDFSSKMFEERYLELLNNVSNLIYRVGSIIKKNDIVLKPKKIDKKINLEIKNTFKKIKEDLKEFKVKASLQTTMAFAQFLNKYINDKEPWKLIKDNRMETEEVMYNLVYGIEFLHLILSPATPDLMNEVKDMFGFKGDINNFLNSKPKEYKLNNLKMLLKKQDVFEF